VRTSGNGLINGIYRDQAKIRSGRAHAISTPLMELISSPFFLPPTTARSWVLATASGRPRVSIIA
jgi:hypothetical protein